MKRVISQHGTPITIRILFSLALILIVVPMRAQLPSMVVPNGFAVNEHNIGEQSSVLSTIYGTGFRYLRTDMEWSKVETSRGVYNFTAYDTYVANATAAGLKIIFILDYSNSLYDGGYSPYDSAGDTAFANYALATVAHFQGKNILWEMYNEPTGFWTSPSGKLTADSDAATVAPLYASMAIAAGNAIKTAHPKETIIGPALGWFDSHSATYFNNSMTFLQDIFSDGVGPYLDAISVHPYRTVAPESVTTDYGTVLSKMVAGGTIPNKTILSSEWGYSSSNYDAPVGTLSYSDAEALKAKRIARSILINLMSNVPLSVIYDWMDDGTDQTITDQNYGMVAQYNVSSPPPQLTTLPAYSAVKALSSLLAGYTYYGRTSTGDSTDYIVQFKNGTHSVWACWNSAGTANAVTVPLGANVSVTRTDFDGSSVITENSGAHGWGCTESEGPQYLVVNE